jgi:hypothetical protein
MDPELLATLNSLANVLNAKLPAANAGAVTAEQQTANTLAAGTYLGFFSSSIMTARVVLCSLRVLSAVTGKVWQPWVDNIKTVLYTPAMIQSKVQELGAQITRGVHGVT